MLLKYITGQLKNLGAALGEIEPGCRETITIAVASTTLMLDKAKGQILEIAEKNPNAI